MILHLGKQKPSYIKDVKDGDLLLSIGQVEGDEGPTRKRPKKLFKVMSFKHNLGKQNHG